jgi:hypothetical protein
MSSAQPNAIILADSINAVLPKRRATTFLLPRFPYRIIQEIAVHRQLDPCGLSSANPFGIEFSRNSASSRAIPVKDVIERIKEDPYVPHWTRANKGMSGIDGLTSLDIQRRNNVWVDSMFRAFLTAKDLESLGSSKQDCNAPLLPYMRIPLMITGTEWNHFFVLRTGEGVHPDFRAISLEMESLYKASNPEHLLPGEWHIPWLKLEDEGRPTKEKLKISTARSAWLSYAAHDKDATDEKAFTRHDGLLSDRHLSCFEHQVMAMEDEDDYTRFHSFLPGSGKLTHTRNLKGFLSYRAMIEDNLEFD